MAKLAMLFPVFPVFHQTFVLWEVLGLRRNGIDPALYSLRRAAPRQQPEGREILREVHYLPPVWSPAVWAANARLLRRAPRRYVRLYGAVWRAWRTGRVARVPQDGVTRRRVALRNRVRGWFNSHPLPYLLKSWALVPTAVHVAERLQDDGVTHLHVHWASYPATVAYLVHQICGLPFSISAHAYDIYMVPRMLPAKVGAARFLVTCARANARYLQQLAGAAAAEKVIVSYHGVDVARFAPAPEGAAPGGPLRIVSCGQLERYKGMHLLVAACAALRQRGVELECRIVGEGPQRRALQRQIAQLGLHERVHLLGAQPHAEVAALYRRADIFVLASELAGRSGRRDVIANVIVEAMAAGVPVVASRIPGVEELVEDGVTGYTFPPNDADRLAASMAKLAADPAARRRLGQAARRRILKDFDNSKNVRVLARLLSEPSAGAVQQLAVGC